MSLTFKTLWAIIAPVAILTACVASGATVPVIVMSVVGILFVIGVGYHIPETNILGAILCIFYGYYSYEQGFISNTIVNLAILTPLQIISYFVWKGKIKISYSFKNIVERFKIPLSLFLALFYIIVIYITNQTTNATAIDVVSASLVVSATFLLLIESKNQWYYWIPYNALEVLLWLYAFTVSTELLSILIMRLVFLLNSFYGFYLWRNYEK